MITRILADGFAAACAWRSGSMRPGCAGPGRADTAPGRLLTSSTRLTPTARPRRAAGWEWAEDDMCPDDRLGADLRPPPSRGSTGGLYPDPSPCGSSDVLN